MRFVRGCAALWILGLFVGERAANAQAPDASGKIVAEALFEEGRKLVAEGRLAEACPKFSESQRLDPSPATLLNLASCYEKQGRSATAWVTYKEAASAANALNRADYVAAAQRHADALAPKLPRLTIRVAKPIEGLRVERDGNPVDPAEWGTAIPVDPSDHAVFASAPGRDPWSTAIDMNHEGAQVTVVVPELEAAQSEAPAPPETPPPPAVAPLAPPRAESPAPKPARGANVVFIAGWVIGGLGVASAAVGGGFALAAKRKYDDSLANCQSGSNRNICFPEGFSDRNTARTYGDVATWTIAAGAAAVAVGLVMVLVAPRSVGRGAARQTSLILVPAPGSLSLRGEW
jgi:serine/threonine-protein kinase